MNVVAGVAIVNRPDLLRRCVDGFEPLYDRLVLVDNSPDTDLLRDGDWPGRIIRPPVPLSFAQTQNLFQREARAEDAEALIYAHHDAEFTTEALQRLVRELEASRSRDWGVILTSYDVLAAFSRQAIETVGPWDVQLPWYMSDQDWYRRIRLAGLEVIDLGREGVVHQEGASTTIKSDWRLAWTTRLQRRPSRWIYEQKWGGPPGKERYEIPYDGALLCPPLDKLRLHPLYEALHDCYPIGEGTLLEGADDRSIVAQLRTLAWVLEQASPTVVLEVGTAKGYFGYVLSQLDYGTEQLLTVDRDPRCRQVVDLLNEGQDQVRVDLILGESREVLPDLELSRVGMAWIDGGHTEATVLSDVMTVIEAGVPWIAVDDTAMPSVKHAVEKAKSQMTGYVEVLSPWRQDDMRAIAILKRSTD